MAKTPIKAKAEEQSSGNIFTWHCVGCDFTKLTSVGLGRTAYCGKCGGPMKVIAVKKAAPKIPEATA